jgi:hypothetical protein
MIITSNYNKKLKKEKAWFDSSNVFYSEFIEDEFKNEGDLIITFKNGATYKYKNVKMAPDYLMFKHGGLDGSHGKALNKYIKPNYEFEKIEDKNIQQLIEERNLCMKENDTSRKINTYFISGHRNITDEEFMIYKHRIEQIIIENPYALFVVGDYHGTDIMSQNYLVDDLNVEPNKITVYHMFDKPRNINPKITNTIGGFKSDEERDSAMTNASFEDIAFIRNHTEITGTAQNILRRKCFCN